MDIDAAIKLAGESPILFILGSVVFGLFLGWIGRGMRKDRKEVEKLKAELAEAKHAAESFKANAAKLEGDLDVLARLLNILFPKEDAEEMITIMALRVGQSSRAKEDLDAFLEAAKVLGYRVSMETHLAVDQSPSLPPRQARSSTSERSVHRAPGGQTDWQLPSDEDEREE